MTTTIIITIIIIIIINFAFEVITTNLKNLMIILFWISKTIIKYFKYFKYYRNSNYIENFIMG